MSEIFHCRSCKAHVIWAVTERGRRMPMDKEPAEAGTFLLQYRPNQEPLAVYQSKAMLEALAKDGGLQRYRLFTSHFATCPQGNKWRKTR